MLCRKGKCILIHRGRPAIEMNGLLTRSTDYQPRARSGSEARYDRVVYLASPAARGVVGRAAAALPAGLGSRLTVRDLPPGAFV